MAVPTQRSPKEYFCADILRLPPGMTEPDHYTLLGLEFFEQDHGTIVRAAMERIGLLESCLADTRPGYQRALADLVQMVRAAQITLLDVKRRKAYDKTLIGDEEGHDDEEQADDEIELRPGTMVAGRYRVLGEHRRGAFGVVFNALDSNMRTRVELSVLRERLSRDRRSRRRAERGARAAAALDHPNILRVDEVGDADGLLFARTRQIEGKNLLDLIEATPRMRLDEDRVRAILREIAAALAYAHGQDVLHGDLRPHNVFVNAEGRVLVADFRMSRAVQNELGESAPRSRAPEGEESEAADLFSLGCLAYQMLAGMPPFAADTAHYVPRPLPEDVPEDLEVLVTRLLARDPDQRPANAAEVVERLSPKHAGMKRLPLLLSIAATLVVGFVFVLVSRGGGDDSAEQTVRERAWRLIAEKRLDEAIDSLRLAREKTPEDEALKAPLAGALDRKAATLETDPWRAQLLLQEAQELAPQPERQTELERVRGVAMEALQEISVEIPPFTARPIVSVRTPESFAGKVEIAGLEVPVRDGVAQRELEFFDGPHEVTFVLTDRVGNRREGTLATIVDTKAPMVKIVSPRDGQSFSSGQIEVKVTVVDKNPRESVRIRQRDVKLSDGVARDVFALPDGKHLIEAVAIDRAGLEARVHIWVIVDSSIPDLTLDRKELATPDGRAVIRGTLVAKGGKVTVDGHDVALEEDGSFVAPVNVAGDRDVPVVATGSTGLTRKMSVRVVLDRDPPKLSVAWSRRSKSGVLLYGTREMEAKGLRLKLTVRDKTGVRFEPKDGRVENGFWIVDAYQGARQVSLDAIDAANNRARLTLDIDGHRSKPTLIVKNTTRVHTNDDEATLDIEADGTLWVLGTEREPGRIKVPLPEGKLVLRVRAEDHYGNEAAWSKEIHVDRTKPKITLAGGLGRGVGRQEIRFDADEEIATLTCFGRTNEVGARSARIMADFTKPGRRRVSIIAKDRAGNTTRQTFRMVITSKVLLLDGKSALLLSLPDVRLTEFTIECWVRGTAGAGQTVVVSRSGRRSGFGLYWRHKDQGVPYAALVIQNAGFTALPARKGWKWDRWTHLALCHDGKRARYYVNGSLQHTVVTKGPLQTGNAPLLIGAGPDSRNRPRYMFNGAIDEVRLSKVARYQRAFGPQRYLKQDADTLVLLRFDTMVGDKVADTSGHNRHATRLGNPQLAEENR